MKEHALFLQNGPASIDTAFAKEAEFYKRKFEKILFRAVSLGNEVVTRTTLYSGEFFTEFTVQAESQTERLTGIPINQMLTLQKKQLHCGKERCFDREKSQKIYNLNQRALQLVKDLMALKEKMLSRMLLTISPDETSFPQ